MDQASEFELLPMRFKGVRDYVHGTDLVDGLTVLLQPRLGGFLREIRFHSLLQTHPYFSLRPVDGYGAPASELTWTSEDGTPSQGWLYESGQAVAQRYEYLEEKASDGFNLTPGGGYGSGYQGFSFAENVVAMTKASNLARLRPKSGQWLWARARFVMPAPGKWRRVEIQTSNVGSEEVTNNLVKVDGVEVGKLLFMVGKK